MWSTFATVVAIITAVCHSSSNFLPVFPILRGPHGFILPSYDEDRIIVADHDTNRMNGIYLFVSVVRVGHFGYVNRYNCLSK